MAHGNIQYIHAVECLLAGLLHTYEYERAPYKKTPVDTKQALSVAIGSHHST